MKEIKLTQGQVALVDDDDYERVAAHPWWPASRSMPYPMTEMKVGGKTRTVRLSRFIMRAQVEMVVDHINHDPLDNRKVNLRICTNSENMRNRIKHQRATSKYKGVYMHTQAQVWVAQIQCDSRRHYLGLYDDEVDAALAYDRKARELHGDFALLNFPEAVH